MCHDSFTCDRVWSMRMGFEWRRFASGGKPSSYKGLEKKYKGFQYKFDSFLIISSLPLPTLSIFSAGFRHQRRVSAEKSRGSEEVGWKMSKNSRTGTENICMFFLNLCVTEISPHRQTFVIQNPFSWTGLWHDPFICDMNHSCAKCMIICDTTHSYATWLIYVRRDSFMCDAIISFVTWLIHVWHVSFICDMTHVYVTYLIYMRRDSLVCDVSHSYVTQHFRIRPSLPGSSRWPPRFHHAAS